MGMISLPPVGMYRFSRSSIPIGLLLFFCAFALESAYATTKGLSQILTPNVQPVGNLSPSFQWQAKEIANPYQFQAEIGLTRWFEVAVFQGPASRDALWRQTCFATKSTVAAN
jgi:hypothetical protein